MLQYPRMPSEVLIQLHLNGRFFSRILCSPVDVRQLVVGWLFTHRLIENTDEIHALGVCEDLNDVRVELGDVCLQRLDDYRPVTTSGCSGGEVASQDYLGQIRKVISSACVDMSVIPGFMSAMFTRLRETCPSGGMHCASLIPIDNHSEMLTGCDIGRHNAVDKVIGAALLGGVDFGSSLLATSGRISSDMVLKAARAGVPVLLSPRSVTTMAADLADRADIAIVGRLSKSDRLITGNKKRITGV